MQKLKLWMALLFFSLAIPLVGIVVSTLVLNGFHTQYNAMIVDYVKKEKGIDISNNQDVLKSLSLDSVCPDPKRPTEFNEACSLDQQLHYLNLASWVTLIFSISLMLSISALGKISRKNRDYLLNLFRPALFLAQIGSALLVIANAAILIATIYFGESYYLERVHIILIGIAGIIAGLVALKVLATALSPIKPAEARIFGKILPKLQYPKIWNFIELLSEKVGATPPDTIIAGMEPTFFVTETKVICLDGEIQGKTLFLSLPFCRSLTTQELTGIIGHEMGHFIGEDTKWSQKFYPIYKGSVDTISSLQIQENQNAVAQLALLPSILFMSLFITSFAEAEREISREREINADKIGVKLSSPLIMGTALTRAYLYQHAWQITQSKMVEAIGQEKHIVNISTFFRSICSLMPEDFVKKQMENPLSPTHPTDTHPPLLVRLHEIGIEPIQLYESLNLPEADLASDLIEEVNKIEEELSLLEHQKLIQLGIAKINHK